MDPELSKMLKEKLKYDLLIAFGFGWGLLMGYVHWGLNW